MARFESDARYRAVDSSREREDLFEDYMWELKRTVREQRRQQAVVFRQILAEATHLNGRSRWADEEVRTFSRRAGGGRGWASRVTRAIRVPVLTCERAVVL